MPSGGAVEHEWLYYGMVGEVSFHSSFGESIWQIFAVTWISCSCHFVFTRFSHFIDQNYIRNSKILAIDKVGGKSATDNELYLMSALKGSVEFILKY